MRGQRGSACGERGVFFPAPVLRALGLGALLSDRWNMSEAPGAPRALLFTSSSDRVEWWGAGAAGRGVTHMAPWVGPACRSWCRRAGFEAGRGCQAGQVLSHLAAAAPSPAISGPVRSALAGPSVTESTNQEAGGGAGSPVPWRPPVGVSLYPTSSPGCPSP